MHYYRLRAYAACQGEGRDPAMPNTEDTDDRDQDHGNVNNIIVYCRRFSDFVPVSICAVRKRDLNPFGWNSCSGCAVGFVENWIDAGRTGREKRYF